MIYKSPCVESIMECRSYGGRGGWACGSDGGDKEFTQRFGRETTETWDIPKRRWKNNIKMDRK